MCASFRGSTTAIPPGGGCQAALPYGGLIASFLDAGEIDEFDIHVIPTLIGEGIPLVAPRHRDVPLRLRSVRKYPDGAIRVRYEVAT